MTSARVAYGDDGPRWIPEASPLLFQLELTAAYAKEQLTGSGFVVSYSPYRGDRGTINLLHPERNYAPLPDFWWAAPGESTQGAAVAALLAVIGVGSGLALVRQSPKRGELRRPIASSPSTDSLAR